MTRAYCIHVFTNFVLVWCPGNLLMCLKLGCVYLIYSFHLFLCDSMYFVYRLNGWLVCVHSREKKFHGSSLADVSISFDVTPLRHSDSIVKSAVFSLTMIGGVFAFSERRGCHIFKFFALSFVVRLMCAVVALFKRLDATRKSSLFNPREHSWWNALKRADTLWLAAWKEN